MDFAKLLPHCKFMYRWNNQEDIRDLEVSAIERDCIHFHKQFPLPVGDTPQVTISLKVRHVWYEHSFDQSEWIVGDSGQICGLRLLGPTDELHEWKKNLEIGLCV